jgi:dUTP pyrophosphatase
MMGGMVFLKIERLDDQNPSSVLYISYRASIVHPTEPEIEIQNVTYALKNAPPNADFLFQEFKSRNETTALLDDSKIPLVLLDIIRLNNSLGCSFVAIEDTFSIPFYKNYFAKFLPSQKVVFGCTDALTNGTMVEKIFESKDKILVQFIAQHARLLTLLYRDFQSNVFSQYKKSFNFFDIEKVDRVPVYFMKLDPSVQLPEYATLGSAGADIFTLKNMVLVPLSTAKLATGFALQIPFGYSATVRPRSSTFMEGRLEVLIATYDSDYRGEMNVCVKNLTEDTIAILKGQRIAQILIEKSNQIRFIETSFLVDTGRGLGGFGSTGSQEMRK